MSLIRVGSSKKYSDGWSKAFAKKGGKGSPPAKKSAKTKARRKK